MVGFDLTFSAPKSVSVLFAAGDEQTAGQLIAAHESAVRAALALALHLCSDEASYTTGQVVSPNGALYT